MVAFVYIVGIALFLWVIWWKRVGANNRWVKRGWPVFADLREFATPNHVGVLFGPNHGLESATAIIERTLPEASDVRRADRELCGGLVYGLETGELTLDDAKRVMGLDADGIRRSGAFSENITSSLALADGAFSFIGGHLRQRDNNVAKWATDAGTAASYLAWHVVMIHRLGAVGIVDPLPKSPSLPLW